MNAMPDMMYGIEPQDGHQQRALLRQLEQMTLMSALVLRLHAQFAAHVHDAHADHRDSEQADQAQARSRQSDHEASAAAPHG